MGGSWFGDTNHCWDYCFGKEEQLSTAIVNIVREQSLDGVDLDYEVSLIQNLTKRGSLLVFGAYHAVAVCVYAVLL